ncbi:hypothetical protein OROHE_001142 [Orobanche hederae]
MDHLLCILPLEAEICRPHGPGHPTLEVVLELKNNKSIPNDWNVQGYGEEFIKRYGVYPE